MSQALAKKNFSPGSLRADRSVRTVLLRMAADQDRAERIKALKAQRPDLTWREIAEAVGVTERAANEWAKSGGIAYDNAKKLAVVFDVDVDYIMRGSDTTPDPFAGLASEQLDRIERRQKAIESRLDELVKLLKATRRTKRALQDLTEDHEAEIHTPERADATAESAPARPSETTDSASKPST